MTDDIAPILARLTWNGAHNLMQSVVAGHERFPDLLNGGRRLHTGLGKWTTLAAIGVENNLIALKLIEPRWLPWNGPERHQGWESPCLTPLGRRVAEHLRDHWDTLTFRDAAERRPTKIRHEARR